LCEFETHDYKDALLNLQRGRTLGLRGNNELVNVSGYHEALILNLTGRFEASTDLLVSLASRGMRSESVKVAFGMAMLRIPRLPGQLAPSKEAIVRTAGEIGVMTALNNYDAADAAFRRMLSEHPRTPFLHYAYGSLLTTMTRFDDAEREFKAELQFSPGSAMPYMQLAYLDLATNRNADALIAARRAITLEPKSFAAHYFAGRALLEQGKVTDALKELETARQLEPSSPEVHYNLARAYDKAQRPQDAARERAEFSRLNLPPARQQRNKAQTYGTDVDRGGIQPQGFYSRSAQP
jgi:predicted Zn-dependent protease